MNRDSSYRLNPLSLACMILAGTLGPQTALQSLLRKRLDLKRLS